MSGKRKKRSKKYQGEDAQIVLKPVTHHYTAVTRSPFGEWWHANRRRVVRWTVIGAASILIAWLLVDAIRALTGN